MTARLALVGGPGAGKTAVARELAARWGCSYVDTDEQYERMHARTVADAVICDESGFRRDEQTVVVEALRNDGAVIAVGSGALASAQVRDALARVPTVWLDVGLAQMAKRTGLSAARPVALGNVRGQLHEMLQQRAAVYAAVATATVNTDGRTVAEVADDVEEVLR